MNLVKYIAGCGIASRRAAETMIRSGRITVNGQAECNPARRLDGTETVCCDGKPALLPATHHYILLHKPRGCVCSSADRHAEKLALDLIDLPGVRLVSAGRLDKESEGAIVFSDDGAFINHLSHPRYGVIKRYIVDTAGPISPADLKRMISGIADDGEMLRVEAVTELAPQRYEFLLNEGKKREIRRLTAACGAPTVRLCRVAVGPVELGELACGKWRELTASEVAALLHGPEPEREERSH